MKPAQVSTGAGGKQVVPWRACAHRLHLCACLVRTKQLAGMGQHSAGPARWAGQVSVLGRRSLSLSSKLFSVFYFSVTSGLYLKYQNVFKNPENNCGLCLEYSQQPSLKFRIK